VGWWVGGFVCVRVWVVYMRVVVYQCTCMIKTKLWSIFCKHCNTVYHTATHCNTLQHTATHCKYRGVDVQWGCIHNTPQHNATTHCSTLHHTVVQHTKTHYNTLQNFWEKSSPCIIFEKNQKLTKDACVCKCIHIYRWLCECVHVCACMCVYSSTGAHAQQQRCRNFQRLLLIKLAPKL